jgi:hypothetical protein
MSTFEREFQKRKDGFYLGLNRRHKKWMIQSLTTRPLRLTGPWFTDPFYFNLNQLSHMLLDSINFVIIFFTILFTISVFNSKHRILNLKILFFNLKLRACFQFETSGSQSEISCFKSETLSKTLCEVC